MALNGIYNGCLGLEHDMFEGGAGLQGLDRAVFSIAQDSAASNNNLRRSSGQNAVKIAQDMCVEAGS